MGMPPYLNPVASDSASKMAGRSFHPHESDRVWLIESGKIDLFLQDVRHDRLVGARTHLTRLEQGQALFGVNAQRYPGVSLVASLHPGTTITPISLDDLRSGGSPQWSAQMPALIQEWIRKLYSASHIVLPPRTNRGIAAGVTISAQDARVNVVPEGDTVWVRQLTGTSLFAGSNIEVASGTHVPLSKSGGAWLQVGEDCCVAGVEFSLVQSKDPKWKWLDDFHDLILNCFLDNAERIEAQKKEQLQRQKEADARLVHRTLLGLATPLLGLPSGDAKKAITKDPLLAACRALESSIESSFRPPTSGREGLTGEHRVAAIAKASGVRFRRVVLGDQWWKRDCGPLLAFTRDGNRPVALLPQNQARYKMYDPAAETTVPVTRDLALSLATFAYSFYRPLPAKKLGGRDLLLFGLKIGRRELMLIAYLGIAGGVLSMAFPVLTGIIFDRVIPGAERGQLVQLAWLLLAAAFSTALFTLVRSLAVLRLEGRIDATAQAAMWDRVLRLPVPFFRNFSSGDLAVRSLAITSMRQLLTNSTLSSILSGFFSIFSFVLLFYYSWVLALLASALVLVALVFSVACGYAQLRYTRRMAPLRGKISSMLLQFINGITKLRVSGTENRVFAAWAAVFAEQKGLYLRIRRIGNRLMVFNSVFPILALAVLFWIASPMVSSAGPTALTTGAFLAFLAAFTQFLNSSLQLSSSLISILGLVPIYERALPIFETLPEVDEAKSDPGELQGGIEVAHVSFRYEQGGPIVLRDISFTTAPGEFVAFTGPSGSGKSTLLRLLLGFEQPESGIISYDGQDITDFDIQAVRRQTGVVLQSGRLVSGTIFDNIVGSLPLTHDDAWRAAELAGVSRDIKAMPMGMHTFVSDGGGGFSGGQRQRLMIARAIVNKPRILFFDEATSALDNETQAIVSRSLESLRATRVVIAHRLSTIMNADRILIFDKGAIVQVGKYEELLNQPGLFRELVQRQMV
jgi:NHLM bacteriocin system ABC transporter ATP-binding protein